MCVAVFVYCVGVVGMWGGAGWGGGVSVGGWGQGWGHDFMLLREMPLCVILRHTLLHGQLLWFKCEQLVPLCHSCVDIKHAFGIQHKARSIRASHISWPDLFLSRCHLPPLCTHTHIHTRAHTCIHMQHTHTHTQHAHTHTVNSTQRLSQQLLLPADANNSSPTRRGSALLQNPSLADDLYGPASRGQGFPASPLGRPPSAKSYASSSFLFPGVGVGVGVGVSVCVCVCVCVHVHLLMCEFVLGCTDVLRTSLLRLCAA